MSIDTYRLCITGYVNAVDISTDGKLAVSGGEDGAVRDWGLEAERVKTPEGHTNYISAVAMSPDGGVMVTAGFDECIKVCPFRGGDWKEYGIFLVYILSLRSTFKFNSSECAHY